jgi:hypothetical protein
MMAMANPAELLHELLLSWKVSGNDNATAARKIQREGWGSSRRAANLLDQVIELLRRAKEDGYPQPIAESHIGVWSAMVFAYPYGWSNSGKDNLDVPALNVLGQTAATLRMYVPTFEEKGPEHLDAFLRAVENHHEEDNSNVSKHAKRVCAHLKKLLGDVEGYGEFRIVDALNDLQRILDELADTRPDDPFWQKASRAAWSWFKKDVILTAITGIAVGALTAGASYGHEIVEAYIQQELNSGEGHQDSPSEGTSAESAE